MSSTSNAGPGAAVSFSVRAQTAADLPAIDSLLDEAFGPGRHAKASYRLREGANEAPGLSMVAHAPDGSLIGSIRYWPIVACSADGTRSPLLLLGPLVVRPDLQGKGVGLKLMADTLAEAAARGHRLVILVGDLPYYARVGFSLVPARQVRMPYPYDPARLLWRDLVPGAGEAVTGVLAPASGTLPPPG